MVRKTAVIDNDLCDPEKCGNGTCAALPECPRKLIKQEAPYEVPYVYGDPSLCRGCFSCIQACPLKAVFKI
ncbi:MAG: ferredoxin [Dehalococcoidia bacterium]|nr:ferredoxin [Dehalococcoidia bacterium]MDZ4247219.1 ferredoxin [Dehalococcoidia bacterium]